MLHEQAMFEGILRLDVQLLEVPPGSGSQRQHAHQAVDKESGDLVLGHHHAAHEFGQIDHRLSMGPALYIIGFQYCRRGMAAKDPGQLPGKVGAISKSRNQALPDKRRGDVRCVAGEEDASLAEFVAAARVESIHRLAFDLQLLRVDPWRDQPGYAFRAFQLFPGFAWV
ncbi:hypothetical protein D3C85_1435850 [compost metagenome]